MLAACGANTVHLFLMLLFVAGRAREFILGILAVCARRALPVSECMTLAATQMPKAFGAKDHPVTVSQCWPLANLQMTKTTVKLSVKQTGLADSLSKKKNSLK